MNEFKGTGGRWVLKQQGDANEYCIVTDDMKWVSAFKLNGEQSKETQLANMNLFTAAPEMLEALQSIAEYWNTPQKGNLSLNDNVEYSLKLAEKTINKALGINGNQAEETNP